jgi:uncharacterized protein (TIGR02145 family)
MPNNFGMKKIVLLLLISFPIIVAAQNVGIGTTTPFARLQINHQGNTTIGLQLVDSGAFRAGSVKFSTINDPVGMYISGNYESSFNKGHLLHISSDSLFIATFRGNGYVGIGTTTPVAKLSIVGNTSSPAIPGATSTGVLRIGINANEGIDFGKLNSPPYSAWMQAGFDGVTPDPLSIQPLGGNVGIGILSPAASAQLDVSSTTKGFLPPRMTIAQRSVITSPVAGLMIWCIDCNQLQVYDGSVWQNIGGTKAVLPSITICSQVWMDKNLDVNKYRNGDPIPKVTDADTWAALTTGAYCYYNNDSATYAATYGKQYNWYAVNDPRGLAPEGWHVPTDFEWTTLSTCLGGVGVAGGAMKEMGTTHWTTPNTGATNISGFTGLPGGSRLLNGTFGSVGFYGNWWCSSEDYTTNALTRDLEYSSDNINMNSLNKRYGLSVRCLRD